MSKYLYQDYLMDFPYDDNENPIVEFEYKDDISMAQEYGTPYNLFDSLYGYNRFISFQYLHDIVDKNKWNEIFSKIKEYDIFILVDDLDIINEEVKEMKTFYLKTYYWNLKQYNKNVFLHLINS